MRDPFDGLHDFDSAEWRAVLDACDANPALADLSGVELSRAMLEDDAIASAVSRYLDAISEGRDRR